MTKEELRLKQREQWETFHKDKDTSEQQYQHLYYKYYKTGFQITNDQRAEVRRAFTKADRHYGNDKLNEMLANHIKEREAYNKQAYSRWAALEDKRADLIEKHGKIERVPKDQWERYLKEKHHYDKEWGENGYQLTVMQNEHSGELNKHEKALYDYHEKHMTPYEKMVREQMREREEFNNKALANWREHERFHDSLEKEYNGWKNVPAYQREIYKTRKENFEREWGDEGLRKQELRKRHHKELAAQIKLEAEKNTNPQKQKDREKE